MNIVNNSDAVVQAFQYASGHIPFYKDFLLQQGVDTTQVTSIETFKNLVPFLSKKEVFEKNTVQDTCRDGDVSGFVSAILSSGTSGAFSYSLLEYADVEKQRKMLDMLLTTLFQAETYPPTIINALPMGVSFVSKYPVLSTSVRSDMVLEVIKLLKDVSKQIILICDPHFLKKVLDEAGEHSVDLTSLRFSCVIGGLWFSDSFVTYVESKINAKEGTVPWRNSVFGTMGITEVGLNIFGSTQDLHAIRHSIQSDKEKAKSLFNLSEGGAVPELLYCMSQDVYVEVVNSDATGVGDVVVTHLDTTRKTMLVRYMTGDKGKIISREELGTVTEIPTQLPFEIIAIFERTFDKVSTLSPADVKEYLYRDVDYVSKLTGHFEIVQGEGKETVLVQCKKGVPEVEKRELRGIEIIPVPYRDFSLDVDLNYENKWRHFSQ